MKAPISSVKHYNQFTQFVVGTGTVTGQEHVTAVSVGNQTNSNEVTEGSVVKAIFIELWLLGNGPGINSYVVIVERTVANQGLPSLSNMSTLQFYANKKNVLFTSQGLVGENDANPTPVLRQWIKIPKGKQRFGFEDGLRVNIAAIGSEDLVGCSFATYKEYN